MYEREQDMMKNESNNTAASEPKQPESTVTNQNPYSTSAATGSTTANHTAETNSTASGTIYGAANRYGSTTPTGYGYTTNSSTNQSTGYTGNTSSDTQSQQQGYSTSTGIRQRQTAEEKESLLDESGCICCSNGNCFGWFDWYL